MLFASLIAVADSGSSPAWNVLRPMSWSSGSQMPDRGLRSAGDNSQLASRRQIGTAEHGRGDEHLTGLRVCRGQHADGRHTVRAHRDVDGALRHRLAQTARTEGDVDHGRVLDQHRDDDLAPGAELGDSAGEARAGLHEVVSRRANDVVHDEVVAAAEQAMRHAAAHSSETDESHLHLSSPQP